MIQYFSLVLHLYNHLLILIIYRRLQHVYCDKTFINSNHFSYHKQRISNAMGIIAVLKDRKRLNYIFSSIA